MSTTKFFFKEKLQQQQIMGSLLLCLKIKTVAIRIKRSGE